MKNKEIRIIIKVNNDKRTLTTVKFMKGFNSRNLSDQLELLGIYENLVSSQRESLSTLYEGEEKIKSEESSIN